MKTSSTLTSGWEKAGPKRSVPNQTEMDHQRLPNDAPSPQILDTMQEGERTDLPSPQRLC